MNKLILFLGFFFNQLMAQELTSFCFESNVSLEEVKQYVRLIQIPEDKVVEQSRQGCLDVVTNPNRVELFQKFILRRFKIVNQAQVKTRNESCHLVFSGREKSQATKSEVAIGEYSTVKRTEENETASFQSEVTTLLGKMAKTNIDGVDLEVTCRRSGNSGMMVSLIAGDQGNKISTDLVFNLGEEKEIGSVFKSQNEKNKTLGIPQATVKGQVGDKTKKYYLKVELE